MNMTVGTESGLSARLTEGDVEALFNIILRRPVNNDIWKRKTVDRNIDLLQFLKELRQSEELERRVIQESGSKKNSNISDNYEFRIPQNLVISKNEVKSILLIGSCLLNAWKEVLQSQFDGMNIERVAFNNASRLPDITAEEASAYDFQLLQMPLRSILKEADFFSIKANDEKSYERLFAMACARIDRNYAELMRYNSEYGIETYMIGFYRPIQNPLGRNQPKYNLSNIGYFIQKLNEYLYNLIESSNNSFFIDLDEIVSTYGKKYFQDDYLTHTNHGSVATDIRMLSDLNRLESAGIVEDFYTPNIPKIIRAVFEEVLAAYKTRRQIDSVKLVIFDLDDTLWRGIAAELDDPDPQLVEGWPLGIIEAASALWRRGILISIVSKNDEENVRRIWDVVIGKKFELSKFVSPKINWYSKADNIDEILKEVNLLPNSVLFVDDNPLERAAVKERFPDIRVMDAPLIEWRRILAWAPELQRSTISAEAADRSETMQALIAREETRKSVGHEEFLQTLGVEIDPVIIASASHPKFERSFELLNKTNQFNTTGRRWSQVEIVEFFETGGRFLTLNVKDNYTNYGLTGLLLIKDEKLIQFVLSCRVFGMGIEQAGVALASQLIKVPMIGDIQPTSKNKLSLNLFADLGYSDMGDGQWCAVSAEISAPKHITIAAIAS